MSVWIGGNSHAAGHINQGNQYDPSDSKMCTCLHPHGGSICECTEIDPKTGKLTTEHMEECTGCALCESDDPK